MKKLFAIVLLLSLLVPLLPLTASAADGDIVIADTFLFKTFRDWIIEHFDRDGNGRLTEEQVLSVTEIDLSGLDYTADLTGIEVFKNLTSLICDGIGLNYLNIDDNPNLQTLICNDNNLSDLYIEGNSKLKTLRCYNNAIGELNLRDAAALEELDCSQNRLMALDLSGNPALRIVDCSGNQIRELDICANPLLLDLVKSTDPEPVQNPLNWTSDDGTRSLTIDPVTELILGPAAGPELPATYKDSTGFYEIANGEATYLKPAKTNISSAKIPDTLTISGVTVPVTSVGPGAFRTNQKKLTKVTLGKNIREIGKNAFFKCTKLKSVSGGANIEIIGGCAFQGCSKLTKFTIGAKVKEIGKKAFYQCAALKKITIKSTLLTAKTVGSSAFKGIKSNATIKVPKAVKKDYTKWLLKKGVKKTMKIK